MCRLRRFLCFVDGAVRDTYELDDVVEELDVEVDVLEDELDDESDGGESSSFPTALFNSGESERNSRPTNVSGGIWDDARMDGTSPSALASLFKSVSLISHSVLGRPQG